MAESFEQIVLGAALAEKQAVLSAAEFLAEHAKPPEGASEEQRGDWWFEAAAVLLARLRAAEARQGRGVDGRVL